MYWRIDVIILFKAMKIKIKNVDFSPKQVFFLALYYGIFIWMPDNVIRGGQNMEVYAAGVLQADI